MLIVNKSACCLISVIWFKSWEIGKIAKRVAQKLCVIVWLRIVKENWLIDRGVTVSSL